MATWPTDSARTKNWGTEILTDSDLETQFDILHAWINDALDGVTGHAHTGGTNDGKRIPLTTSVSGILPTANGGTNISSYTQGDVLYCSATNVLSKLSAGTSGQFLKTLGASANPAWSNFIGHVIQTVNTITGAVNTTTTTIPFDDSLPQSSEGAQFMSLAITPSNASNLLRIDVVVHGAFSGTDGNTMIASLFQDGGVNAIAAGAMGMFGGGVAGQVKFTHYMIAGTTSATTFKVNAGMSAGGTFTFNGSAGSRRFAGVYASSITIHEIGS